MKVLNIGSMNIDYVYRVDHIIQAGETQMTYSKEVFLGGKGMNQSVATAKAGATVYHCGAIGEDGLEFIEVCKNYNIKYDFIKISNENTGHTIIQIDKNAQNSILLYAGANEKLTVEHIDETLAHFGGDDILLLQNETNLLDYIIERAKERNMKIVLNPAPYNEKLNSCDLSKVDVLILNEVEGYQMTGEKDYEKIIDRLIASYPEMQIVLTLGQEGAIYADREKKIKQAAISVKAVDTTAAGDTFTGYFVSGLVSKKPIAEIMKQCVTASAITVTRKGAVQSIPYMEEVLERL